MGSIRYWSCISIGSCTLSLETTQRCDVHNAGRASPQQRRNNIRCPVQFPDTPSGCRPLEIVEIVRVVPDIRRQPARFP